MSSSSFPGSESARLVHSFIEDEAAHVHEALRVSARFSSQRAEYFHDGPIYELQEMTRLYQNLARPPLDFELQNCTWETVIDQMDRAVSDYNSRAERSVARSAIRKLGDVALVVSPVLEMIPDNNGLSVLHGGLAIMFSAARFRAECRQKILRVFEDVPGILEKASRQRAAFPSDERLKYRLDELYSSLVIGVAKMIASLLPSTMAGKLKKPFNQSSVDSALESIQKRVEGVNDCVNELVQRNIIQTRQIVQSSERQLQSIRHDTKMSEIEIRSMSRQLQEVKEHVREINDRSLAGVNALFGFLMDCINEKQRNSEVPTMWQRPCSEINSSATMISVTDLLNMLAVPHLQATQDVDYVLKRGADFNTASLGQARYIVRTDQFSRWIHSLGSELLVVNANLDRHHTDKISPMSVICATLSLAVRRMHQHIISTSFFCGGHTADDDELSGPQGLLRSLISQLLLGAMELGVQINTDFVSNANYVEDIESLRVDALCAVLVQLFHQLPIRVGVFCIIDGVSWYEQHDTWDDGMVTVLNCLKDMVHDSEQMPGEGPRLAALLTSTGRSRRLDEWAGDSLRVNLSSENIGMESTPDRLVLSRMFPF